MKKLFSALVVCMFCVFNSQAQKEQGFGAKLEIGYSFGFADYDNSFAVNVIPLYHINRRWDIGIGVGYRNVNLKAPLSSLSLVPVFFHVQWNIVPTAKVLPFLAYREGALFGYKKYYVGYEGSKEQGEIRGMLMSNLQLGIKTKSDKGAFTAALYIESLLCKEKAYLSYYSGDYNSTNGSIGISLGYEF